MIPEQAHPDQTILLIEDSPDDHEAFVRSFKKAGVPLDIVWASSGENGIDMLRKSNETMPGNLGGHPAVIFLDLNMKGMDGQHVLQILKTDNNLRHIPVIILTTSSNDKDILFCFQMGANAYIQKPVNFSDLVQVAESFKRFWIEKSVLPGCH